MTELVVTLDNIPRVGWVQRGVPLTCAETVARHTLLTSLIGLVLCKLYRKYCKDTVDCEKVLTMCLIHDLPEANIGNIAGHVRKLIDLRRIEINELEQELQDLDTDVKNSLGMTYLEYRSENTTESIITVLSDKLATLSMAMYYLEHDRSKTRELARFYINKIREILLKIKCEVFRSLVSSWLDEIDKVV